MLQLSLLPSCFVFCACVCVCVVGVEWTRLTLINRLFMCAFFSSFVFIVSVCVCVDARMCRWLTFLDRHAFSIGSFGSPLLSHTHTQIDIHHHTTQTHTHTHSNFCSNLPMWLWKWHFFSATLRNGYSWVWIHTVRHKACLRNLTAISTCCSHTNTLMLQNI